MLRSFLVRLDTFNKITSRAVPEGGKVGNTPTYNVDIHADANQFGIGGQEFDDLAQAARDGSLISYPANPAESFDLERQAGRITPPAELLQRLGLDPDFRTDGVGKAYDPWFSWSKQENGTWKWKGFLNNAHDLHDIAVRLREHHLTWVQSKQDPANRISDALIEPDADTIPNAKALPPKDTQLRGADAAAQPVPQRGGPGGGERQQAHHQRAVHRHSGVEGPPRRRTHARRGPGGARPGAACCGRAEGGDGRGEGHRRRHQEHDARGEVPPSPAGADH